MAQQCIRYLLPQVNSFGWNGRKTSKSRWKCGYHRHRHHRWLLCGNAISKYSRLCCLLQFQAVTPRYCKYFESLRFQSLVVHRFSTFKILPRNGKIAWKLGSKNYRLAVPPAESPSTRYTSHFSGSCSEQSDNFPGNPPPPITVLRLYPHFTRFFGSVTGLGCQNHFLNYGSGIIWIFFQTVLVIHSLLDLPAKPLHGF